MIKLIYALILAGGKGTRLYPLSRANNPKQFLSVVNENSFLKNTVNRVKPMIPKENIYVITNINYLDKVKKELPEFEDDHIFVEPMNKETATCIGLAATKLLKKDKDAIMMVFPSDHYINGQSAFFETLRAGADLAEKKRCIVTIGVEADRPETSYGYIQRGQKYPAGLDIYKVERFTEKPNLEVAKDFLMRGNYLWNSGIFIWRADVFLREIDKYIPRLYKGLMEIYQAIGQENENEVILNEYKLIDGISVDFGIMQKTRKAYVISCKFKWDDMGTFNSISKFLQNKEGNSVTEGTYLEDSENCTVFGGERLIIGFGVKDLVIVDAGDVVLVMDKNKDQEMKYLINKLKEDEDLNKYI